MIATVAGIDTEVESRFVVLPLNARICAWAKLFIRFGETRRKSELVSWRKGSVADPGDMTGIGSRSANFAVRRLNSRKGS